MKTNALFIVLCFLLTSCKFIESSSKPNDLTHQKISAQSNVSANSALIYYANPTTQSEENTKSFSKLLTTLSLLEDSAVDVVSSLLIEILFEGVETDFKVFTPQVNKEVENLKHTYCQKQNSTNRSALIVFTNDLAKEGKFLLCLPNYANNPIVEDIDFDFSKEKNPVFIENPLSNPAFISQLENSIQKAFLANGQTYADYAFSFVSKSHGSPDNVIVPKFSKDFTLMSFNDIAKWIIDFTKSVDLQKHSTKHELGITFDDTNRTKWLENFNSLSNDSNNGSSLELFANSSLVSFMRDELFSTINYDLKGALKGDLKGALKGDLKGQLKGELKGQLKGQLKGELKGQLKGQLKGELKGELKGQLKGQLKGELKGQLATDDKSLPDAITKEFFISVLKKWSSKFSVLFLESCNSELPTSLVENLKTEAEKDSLNLLTPDVFASDQKGLNYQTIDWSKIPTDSKNNIEVELKKLLLEVIQNQPSNE